MFQIKIEQISPHYTLTTIGKTVDSQFESALLVGKDMAERCRINKYTLENVKIFIIITESYSCPCCAQMAWKEIYREEQIES